MDNLNVVALTEEVPIRPLVRMADSVGRFAPGEQGKGFGRSLRSPTGDVATGLRIGQTGVRIDRCFAPYVWCECSGLRSEIQAILKMSYLKITG